MKNKKAIDNGWTMTKVVKWFLLIVLFFLIVFGVLTNGLKPLLDDTKTAFNQVLILFHIKSASPTAYDCKPRFLASMPGGENIMKTLGLSIEQQQKASFTLCGRACKLELGEEKYSLGSAVNESELQRFAEIFNVPASEGCKNGITCGILSQVWVSYDEYLKGESVEEARFFHDLYDSFFTQIGIASDKKALEVDKEVPTYIKEFYTEMLTGQILLDSDGRGIKDDLRYAYWNNGKWKYGTYYYDHYTLDNGAVYQATGTDHESTDTKAVLSWFMEEANSGFFSDNVYVGFYDRNGIAIDGTSSGKDKQGNGIGRYLGHEGDDQISSKEADKLISLIEGKIKEYQDRSRYTIENLTKLKSYLDGKDVLLEDMERYTVSLSYDEKNTSKAPLIVLTNTLDANKVYGLAFSREYPYDLHSTWRTGIAYNGQGLPPMNKGEVAGYVPLRKEPLNIVRIIKEKITVIGNSQDYKMVNPTDFEIYVKGRAIRDYLLKLCPR